MLIEVFQDLAQFSINLGLYRRILYHFEKPIKESFQGIINLQPKGSSTEFYFEKWFKNKTKKSYFATLRAKQAKNVHKKERILVKVSCSMGRTWANQIFAETAEEKFNCGVLGLKSNFSLVLINVDKN